MAKVLVTSSSLSQNMSATFFVGSSTFCLFDPHFDLVFVSVADLSCFRLFGVTCDFLATLASIVLEQKYEALLAFALWHCVHCLCHYLQKKYGTLASFFYFHSRNTSADYD
jgi:hypothetical protein